MSGIARVMCVVWASVLLLPLLGQIDRRERREEEEKPQLKRSQVEAMLKADHEKSLEETNKMIQLAEELRAELEKNDRHILSVPALKKTEEIEKLAKRIRNRMKRF
jgi:hypothetical protein